MRLTGCVSMDIKTTVGKHARVRIVRGRKAVGPGRREYFFRAGRRREYMFFGQRGGVSICFRAGGRREYFFRAGGRREYLFPGSGEA